MVSGNEPNDSAGPLCLLIRLSVGEVVVEFVEDEAGASSSLETGVFNLKKGSLFLPSSDAFLAVELIPLGCCASGNEFRAVESGSLAFPPEFHHRLIAVNYSGAQIGAVEQVCYQLRAE